MAAEHMQATCSAYLGLHLFATQPVQSSRVHGVRSRRVSEIVEVCVESEN